MSKRFGGDYSPNIPNDHAPGKTGASPPPPRPGTGAKRSVRMRHGVKASILFLLPLLVLVTAFFQPVSAMVVDLLGGATLLLSAWLTREGLRAEHAFHERTVARRPAIPRKALGSIAMGLGVGALIFGGHWALIPAILLGLVAAGLHLIAFGLDPLRDKVIDGAKRHDTARVVRKIDEAERILDQMSHAIARVHDRHIVARVKAFQATVQQMFRQIEDDPRDLAAARRYLGVYLEGARDATTQFVNLYTHTRDIKIRDDYLAFLDDLDTNFAKRTAAMLTDDRTNFDVEIEVLRDRLKQDNLHTED